MRKYLNANENYIVTKYLYKIFNDDMKLIRYDFNYDKFYDINNGYLELFEGFEKFYNSIEEIQFDSQDDAIVLRQLFMEFCYLDDTETKWLIED